MHFLRMQNLAHHKYSQVEAKRTYMTHLFSGIGYQTAQKCQVREEKHIWQILVQILFLISYLGKDSQSEDSESRCMAYKDGKQSTKMFTYIF